MYLYISFTKFARFLVNGKRAISIKEFIKRWFKVRINIGFTFCVVIVSRKCKQLTMVLVVVSTHLRQIMHWKNSKLSVTSDTATLRIIQNMRKYYQHQTSLQDYILRRKSIPRHNYNWEIKISTNYWTNWHLTLRWWKPI